MEYVRKTFRLEKTLVEKLEKLAEVDSRKLNNYVSLILKEHVKEKEAQYENDGDKV